MSEKQGGERELALLMGVCLRERGRQRDSERVFIRVKRESERRRKGGTEGE